MKITMSMTRHVACVRPDDSLTGAWELMQRMSIRHLPVVASSRLEGILSDRDVLVYSMPSDDGLVVPADMKVENAMTASPMTCTSDATIAAVAKMMVENKIDSVPVVDKNDVLVGLVTSTDLLLLLTDKEDIPLPFTFRLTPPE